MSMMIVGAVLLAAAVGLFAQALFADPVPRVSKSRRLGTTVPTEPLWRVIYRSVVTGVDRVLRSRGWVPFRAAELEMADVKKPLGVVVTWVVAGTAAAFLVGFVLGRSVVTGGLLAIVVPIAAKIVLKVRAGRRRKEFAKQLDNTLRIIASALRAGQSLPVALNSVAADAAPPMSEEITRIINENRLGRDLVVAMLDAAERNGSEDFRWFAEAVEVQRDSGGNLNDIIDTVAETIRGRAEIREKIRAYAAEGKASCYVLMALPIALGLTYSLMNPGYMDPLVKTTVGVLLLILSGILYTVSWFWMRAIIAIKV
ncbi:type II secretion system F family protein [Aeromicrobium sp. NPDC092404]|uniref:type II secretion system F family protein n=1 Tax=Aeromicrobium sp. NPDC092404 TaxID=3154976 RepID=UPI003447611C